MKKFALMAATLGAVVAVAPATAAAPKLAPHAYTAKITSATIPALNATWRLSTTSTGFIITRNGSPALVGALTIAGAKVTFHDISGPLACKGRQVNGTYGWKVVGAKLTLTRFSDACVGRRTVLSYPFTRIA